jgi:putative ABC transport system permease protein
VTGYGLRALVAQVRAGPMLFLLAVLGVALGVAAVLSIQILNQNALGAFAGSVEAVSGGAALSVVGSGPELPERILPHVMAERGVQAAVPLYRIDVALALTVTDRREGTLEVVGTDVFAPARSAWRLSPTDLAAPLRVPGWVAVSPALAAEMGWKLGDGFEVSSGSRRVRLTVGALIDFQRTTPLASRRLAVMDLAQVQALLGEPGRLQQIDVFARAGASVPELASRLQARLGPGFRLVTPEQRSSEASGLLAAFRLNLTALSLVSLLVGVFLVYASVQAALLRRREELGVLRSLGATREQVVAVILGEASLLGLLGTGLGIPLGIAAARANVGTVSGTLQNLYLLEAIERVELSPWLVALAAGAGLAGAAAGALLPALDVSRRDPRALLAGHALQEPARRRAGRLAAAGWGLLAGVALAALTVWHGRPASGFAVAGAVLVAVALSSGWLLQVGGRHWKPRRLSLAYGARALSSRPQTAAVAVGALATATSMLAAITVMVGSFRKTVDVWLGQTLRADVYVTTPSWRQARSEARLSPEVMELLARQPGVRAVDRQRQFFGHSRGRRISIAGFDSALPEAGARVALLAGDPGRVPEALRRGAVLVSEPLARKAHLRVGDAVPIDTPAGEAGFPVAGVYHDYGADSGAVLMDLEVLAARFGPDQPSNAALYLAPGADAQAMVDRLRGELSGHALVIRSNQRLRQEALGIFDQTFAVTRLLQGMALLIALAGVTLALLVLARDRAAELALHRALGATRGQVFGMFLGQGLAIALDGIVLGAAGGVGLALALVFLVNRDTFGWTIDLYWPWSALLGEAGAILAAAALASVYPALRASQSPALELSRDAL